jgi:hypothetical protein
MKGFIVGNRVEAVGEEIVDGKRRTWVGMYSGAVVNVKNPVDEIKKVVAACHEVPDDDLDEVVN